MVMFLSFGMTQLRIQASLSVSNLLRGESKIQDGASWQTGYL